MNDCPACRELERIKAAAEREYDRTKVTDCVVLLRRHPNHTPLPGNWPHEKAT